MVMVVVECRKIWDRGRSGWTQISIISVARRIVLGTGGRFESETEVPPRLRKRTRKPELQVGARRDQKGHGRPRDIFAGRPWSATSRDIMYSRRAHFRINEITYHSKKQCQFLTSQ